jgi:glycosyltransferase involved in cell wall biosynthesis
MTLRPELRVLQVFHTLGVGGAEVWLLEMLRHWQTNAARLPVDLRIDVLLTGGAPAVLDAPIAAAGAQLRYLRYTRRDLRDFARGFRTLLAGNDYHVMHDHQDHSAGLRLLLAVGLWPPLRIVHFHNPRTIRDTYRTGALRSLAADAGLSLVRAFATHLLGTSAQTLREYQMDRAHVSAGTVSRALHCGFDHSRFRGDRDRARQRLRQEFGMQPSDRVVLFVGRLNTHSDPRFNQKNPLFALSVASAWSRDASDIRLLVVGGGVDQVPALGDYVRAEGLERTVIMAGQRSDIPELMLGADLLLFPSLAEGLGMVAVEAQAAGLRVLASDMVPREASVVPELMTFLPLDHGPAAWAAVAQRLLRDPIPDAQTANAAVGASGFAIENSAADLLALYASALRTA